DNPMLLPPEDPFRGDKHGPNEIAEAFEAISGTWCSHEDTVLIQINNRNAIFKIKESADQYLSLLSNKKVALSDNFGFNLESFSYDIYWVWSDPDNMTLIAKSNDSGNLQSITLIRCTKNGKR